MSIKTQKNTGKNGFNRQNLKVKDKSNNPEHTEKQDFENLEELKKIEEENFKKELEKITNEIEEFTPETQETPEEKKEIEQEQEQEQEPEQEQEHEELKELKKEIEQEHEELKELKKFAEELEKIKIDADIEITRLQAEKEELLKVNEEEQNRFKNEFENLKKTVEKIETENKELKKNAFYDIKKAKEFFDKKAEIMKKVRIFEIKQNKINEVLGEISSLNDFDESNLKLSINMSAKYNDIISLSNTYVIKETLQFLAVKIAEKKTELEADLLTFEI